MTKPTIPQYVAAISITLCAYFARYEFEAIKATQREDKAAMLTLHDKLAQLDTKIAVLIAGTVSRQQPNGRDPK